MKPNILRSAILILLLCLTSFACQEDKEEENGYTIKVDANFLEPHQKAAYFISEDFSNAVLTQGIIQNGTDIRILLKDLGEIPYPTFTFSYIVYDNKLEEGKYKMYSNYSVALQDVKELFIRKYVPQERSEQKTQIKLNCNSLGNYYAFGNEEDDLGVVNSNNYYSSPRDRRIVKEEEDGIFTISRTEFPERKEDFAFAIKKVRPNQLTEYNCEDFIVGQKADYVNFDFASYLLQTDYTYDASIYGMTEDRRLIEYGGNIQSNRGQIPKTPTMRHNSWYPNEFVEDKHSRFLVGLFVRDRSQNDDSPYSSINRVIQSPTIPRSISLNPVRSELEVFHYFGDLDIEQNGDHFRGYVVLRSRNEEYAWNVSFPNGTGISLEIPEFSQEVQAHLSILEFNEDLYVYSKLTRYDERYKNDYSSYTKDVFSSEQMIDNTLTKSYWTVYKQYYENFEGKAEENIPFLDYLKEF